MDLQAERERLRAEIARVDGANAGLRTRLGNPQFTDRAPAPVVQKERDRLAEGEELARTLAERLAVLAG